MRMNFEVQLEVLVTEVNVHEEVIKDESDCGQALPFCSICQESHKIVDILYMHNPKLNI